MVAHRVATEHVHIVYGAMVAHRGIGQHTARQPLRQMQVAVVEIAGRNSPQAYLANKNIVVDKVGIKSTAHTHSLPVFGTVAKTLQLVDLLTRQFTERLGIHD